MLFDKLTPEGIYIIEDLDLFKIIAIPKKNNIRKEDNGVNSVLKKIKPNLGCFFLEINLNYR